MLEMQKLLGFCMSRITMLRAVLSMVKYKPSENA
jgi:hypothetical protein